jgi:hypothetical protein
VCTREKETEGRAKRVAQSFKGKKKNSGVVVGLIETPGYRREEARHGAAKEKTRSREKKNKIQLGLPERMRESVQ